MKLIKHYPNIIRLFILSILIAFSGCSENSQTEPTSKKALLPDNFIANDDIGSSLGVKNARDANHKNQILVVEGFIGGMKNPFTANRAMFVLGDDSLETCDEKPGDNCPTPWDVCCEDRQKIVASTISVQIIDHNGTIIDGTLEGVNGIKAGKRVKVKGRVSNKSTAQSFILNAEQIQLLN
jgi:hypothetical protein